jgi:DNA relaxase NicK
LSSNVIKSFKKNNKGNIFKIGNRRNNQYSRIYQKDNSLRFANEMKGKFIQSFSDLLINDNLAAF